MARCPPYKVPNRYLGGLDGVPTAPSGQALENKNKRPSLHFSVLSFVEQGSLLPHKVVSDPGRMGEHVSTGRAVTGPGKPGPEPDSLRSVSEPKAPRHHLSALRWALTRGRPTPPFPAVAPHGDEVMAGHQGAWGGEGSRWRRYLNERGWGLGGGDHSSVGEAGRQRWLLCQEKCFSGIWAHWELRHNLKEKGEVRTPSLSGCSRG